MASNPPTPQSLPPPRQTPSSASLSSSTTMTSYQEHLAKLIRSEIASLNSLIATLERRQESISTLRKRMASEEFACGWVGVLMGRGDGEVGCEDDEDGNDVGQGGEAGEANGRGCEQAEEGGDMLVDVGKRDSHGAEGEGAGAQGMRALKSASAVDVGVGVRVGSGDTQVEAAVEKEGEAEEGGEGRRNRAESFSEGITGGKKKERRGIWRSRWRMRK